MILADPEVPVLAAVDWSLVSLIRKHPTVKSWDTLAISLLGAWPFIFYWPVAIGQQVFIASDILLFFLPVHTELARALAEGRLPLWAPGMEAGFPLLAEGQVAALYPLNLLLHQLLPPSTAVSYMILMNWAWGSIGMYLLCRASGLRSPSALLAGLVFGDGGFMTARVPHVSFLSVASWLPWLLLFQQRYWRARLEGGRTAVW